MLKHELAHAWGVNTIRAHSFDTRERTRMAGKSSKNDKNKSSRSAPAIAGILLASYANAVQYLPNNYHGKCLSNTWQHHMHNSCTPLVKARAVLMHIASSMNHAHSLWGIICLSFLSFNASKFQARKIYCMCICASVPAAWADAMRWILASAISVTISFMEIFYRRQVQFK